jgi:hypothetical protein
MRKNSMDEERGPSALKPAHIPATYAALKGRSSTAMHAFLSFSATALAAEVPHPALFTHDITDRR